MANEIKVTFEPSGRSVYVLPGTILLEATARAGFIIETPCGGAGKCGKCLVRVTSGDCRSCDTCSGSLSDQQVRNGFRLACQCRVAGELVVEVPESSLFQTSQRILSHDTGGPMDIQPTVVKRFLDLQPPGRETVRSDAESITEALGPIDIDISVMRLLPHVLRETEFSVTVTLVGNRVVHVEPGDTTQQCAGLAFDIGTTTLVGTMINLATGKDLAVASRINPQTSYGDDVVSRIKRCRDDEGGLQLLHEAVLEAVNEIVCELVEKTGCRAQSLCAAVFAGNTTMQEILCGINPSSLGELPFVPTFRESLQLKASDMGLAVNDNAQVLVFPQIGGFVGGDTVAGIVATRLADYEEPALLVDVGTNGEIVLAHKGKLIATSVAAGPAFEGARIINGMRAAGGAIEKVVLDGDVEINVIGNVKPSGLCGTGLIDAVAAMLQTGVLDITGRILGPDELPTGIPEAIRKRVVPQDDHFEFILVHAEQSATGDPLCLYQRDIRELQLANGAIRAGISILLRGEGLEPTDVGHVLLAGAFGNFIRRKSALRVGMLPPIPTDRIRFVGNTASFGAKRVLLSTSERDYAEKIMRETTHVDLSLDPAFQMEFSEAMLFPAEDEFA